MPDWIPAGTIGSAQVTLSGKEESSLNVPATQEQIDRRINDFASRCFRDIADRDYIAARLASRALLIPQFLWSAQQAVEKYLKYFLLVHRIKATKVRHDIHKALELTKRGPFPMDLSPPCLEFINTVAELGEYRYLDVSYFVQGYALLDLDRAVWELRRYCQLLDTQQAAPSEHLKRIELAKEQIRQSKSRPPHEFKVLGGYLEEVLANKKHAARSPLIWNNAFFGNRKRETVRAHDHFIGENAPLYLFPQMLDQLLEYVFIPPKLVDQYRLHLAEVEAGRITP